jgi:hypothetical protein
VGEDGGSNATSQGPLPDNAGGPNAHESNAGPADASATSQESAVPMFDVHAPHETVHTWQDFFIHIATIVIGLLIAVGLEQTVEFFHHRHQAREGLDLLRREVDENRAKLQYNVKVLALVERQHRADIGVLRRLRAGILRPGDRLIFIRPYNALGSSAWKVVHESDAAAYIPHDLMALHDELYEGQQGINEDTRSSYIELQKATAALNTEQDDKDAIGEDRIQLAADYRDEHRAESLSSMNAETFDADMSKLSGVQDLSRLTPPQIDRLEQGFQQAVTDDRRLHRLYIYLGNLYDEVAKRSN